MTLADRPPASAPLSRGRRWRAREEVEIHRGQALLIEFSEEAGLSIR